MSRGTAHCADVLSPTTDPPGVVSLRIVERVEGFRLERFDDRRAFLGDLLFETMDEAMEYVYDHYDEVTRWRPCPDDGATPNRGPD
jgi:hypothetical protein